MKRRKVLEKKKSMEELMKEASAVKDQISLFPRFRCFDRNGLSVYLESGVGEKLSSCMKRYIQTLLKINMAGPYGAEWKIEEKVKRREMVAAEARYIFARDASIAKVNETSSTGGKEENCTLWMGDGDPVVGFVQYRFVLEENVPVIYVYELQLEPHVQGKGLGIFLMQLIELIACQYHMSAVMLTVQKQNLHAMKFYISKLRYAISTTSPSKVGAEKNYEILCKAFDREAKAKLEVYVPTRVLLASQFL
ncbi:hypothetical protein Scep_016196 [Stephania cephalantha]|uniref:N-alpha-acetyltransferase 40 n=1 Tax=Stephania cephalantha TaxID=152367 RepID=A0AAP0NSZ8_9MAGN